MQAQYAGCCAFHLEACQRLETTNATKIHRETYQEAKVRFPALPASSLQTARDKAISTQRGYSARVKKGKKAKPPTFNGHTPLAFHQDNLAVVERGGRFILRLSTSKARSWLWLPLERAEMHADTLRDLKHGASELHRNRKGEWFLSLTVSSSDVPKREGEVVFGVDLGIVNHAVLSGPGVVRFWNGRPARKNREYHAERRRELGKAKLLPEIRRSKGKEQRWMRDLNHKISREIVDTVAENGGAIIKVERLLGIRERTKATRKVNRMVNSWTFRELITFITYKAVKLGILVVEVDPRQTSRTCPECVHAHKGNRPTQSEFKCQKCGYTANADYVASRNIALKSMPAG